LPARAVAEGRLVGPGAEGKAPAGVSRRAEAEVRRVFARLGRWLSLGALVAGAWGLGSCSALGRESMSGEPTATPDALHILESVRLELIPADGSATGYGPSFTAEGYELLRQWNVGIRPKNVWADDYARLDIGLPCCSAAHPYADEAKNCGCGHHQALYGLAKRLLRAGSRPTMVQGEIGRWRAFMFPRETLQAEMERRALEDPAIRQALEELRQQGIC